MPTTRRRISRGRSRVGELSEIAYLYYTFGDFFEAEDYEDGKSESELKSFWDKHKNAIMERYLKENCEKSFKGVRPWSFWKWEMSEPQGEFSPGDGSVKIWNHQLNIYGFFENDFEYLARLNLLEAWELEP
jgi:hypothetical protein